MVIFNSKLLNYQGVYTTIPAYSHQYSSTNTYYLMRGNIYTKIIPFILPLLYSVCIYLWE